MRFSLLLLLLMTACTSCAVFPSVVGQTPREQHNAMVLIKKTCANGAIGLGTGLMVSEDRVLTARHVIQCEILPGVPVYQEPERVDVYGSPEDFAEAEVELELNEKYDIARLKLVNKNLAKFFTPVRVAPMPEVGEKICEVSAVPRPTYRCGEAQNPLYGKLMIGFPIERGNSGSAVFNDRGELVGIVTNQIMCERGSTGICGGFGTPMIGFSWLIPTE